MTANKDFKYYHLLNLINHLGPISRTELTNITDYRSGSVGDMVKEMIDSGLVTEAGHASVGHGRSRSLLEINHTYLCSIGVAFTEKKIHILAALADGTILKRLETPITEDELHDSLIGKVISGCSEIVADLKEKKILGIGIATPSYNPTLHESETLEENFVHFNDWITVDLKKRLESVLNIPVDIISSIGLPGIAEYHYGAARYTQTFICVELSNGIGSSIITNGIPMSGATNCAGSLGHTVVELDPARPTMCNCGKANCVEATSAWPAIKKEIIDALESGVYSLVLPIYKAQGTFRAKDVAGCIERGDQLCRTVVRNAALRIGVAVANEINLINPEKVIFHSFMLELGSFFTDHITEAIQDNVLSLAKNVEIIYSENYETIRPQGAAAEVVSTHLHSRQFNWIYLSNQFSADNPENTGEA